MPDGSKAMIPAEWTDYQTVRQQKHISDLGTVDDEGKIGTISDLLHLRRIVDSIIQKIESSQKQYASFTKEAKHAARISNNESGSAPRKSLEETGKGNAKRCHSKTRKNDSKDHNKKPRKDKGVRK